ncbi:M4 family metallopeptidase [Nocardioides mangrovicus]|nr:M4 family metallopeptidase [Nocardioides mangrovicus]
MGALVLGSLGLAGTPAQASGASDRARSDHGLSAHSADRSFGPSQERTAMKEARRSAKRVARQLKLGSGQRLVAKDVAQDVDGARHVHYDRTFHGLPVVGGDLVVHESKAGAPKRVSWAASRAIKVAKLTPRLKAAQVAGTGDRKVIYAAHHRPRLAWASKVTGTAKDGTPINDAVYTDARSGKRLGVDHLVKTDTGTGNSLYLGSVSLTTTAGGDGWNLVDGDRGGHATYDANNSESDAKGTLFTDADNTWGDGTTSDRQSAAVDAAYGAAKTWDYYLDTFGRNGIADDGQAAYSRVHYGNSYENAFWDDSCFCMTYGDGGSTFKPLVALDVAGHEMTHGVTANSAGLDYSGDAGGLNESTSDVFGTMVEFSANDANDPGDYLIGETIAKDGTWLRRMDDPSADGGSVNCYDSSTGDLDPHYSSGVGNHLFYLLAEGTGAKTIGGKAHDGETCDGTSLTGIGRDAAAAIWYRALTTYWTSTTTYPEAADGQVQAAKDLYGAGSTECEATVSAWSGVDVTPSTSCS